MFSFLLWAAKWVVLPFSGIEKTGGWVERSKLNFLPPPPCVCVGGGGRGEGRKADVQLFFFYCIMYNTSLYSSISLFYFLCISREIAIINSFPKGKLLCFPHPTSPPNLQVQNLRFVGKYAQVLVASSCWQIQDKHVAYH